MKGKPTVYTDDMRNDVAGYEVAIVKLIGTKLAAKLDISRYGLVKLIALGSRRYAVPRIPFVSDRISYDKSRLLLSRCGLYIIVI
jgi:hypothetical protein